MDILAGESVRIDSITGHGGYFKATGAGQKMLAAALHTPVSVMSTAGEGGPWGMALLSGYRAWKEEGESLEAFLRDRVFAGTTASASSPTPKTKKASSGI